MVQNLDDVYSIGTFAQIHEVQDLGDRLRLVVMAHRRIKIVGQVVEDVTENAPAGNNKLLYITFSLRNFFSVTNCNFTFYLAMFRVRCETEISTTKHDT